MTAPSARSAAAELAADLADTLLAADPFAGTGLGLREYDALLPDPSAEAEERLAERLAELDARAAGTAAAGARDRVTLASVRQICRLRQDALATRPDEFTVSAMPFAGPPALLALAARTVLADADAAGDYLTRLRGAAAWLDGTTQRLREGRAKGRFPVAELVDQALAWADHTLATAVPPAFLAPQPPEGWDRAAAWRQDVETVVRTRSLRPWAGGAICWPSCARSAAATTRSVSRPSPVAPRTTCAASRCTPRCRSPPSSCTRWASSAWPSWRMKRCGWERASG